LKATLEVWSVLPSSTIKTLTEKIELQNQFELYMFKYTKALVLNCSKFANAKGNVNANNMQYFHLPRKKMTYQQLNVVSGSY